MQSLSERYRPRSWPEVLGQDKIVQVVQRLAASPRSLGGRAYWLSGKSGTGKTTIARLMAAEIADEINTHEIDATALTVSALREIEAESSMYGLGARSGRCYIVNEAHGLRRDTIRQLLVVLERIPDHAAWVFTTTKIGAEALFDDCDDASPLVSRCLALPLAERGLADLFAERALAIAHKEGLSGKTIQQAKRLVNDCTANMRQVLNQIEAGALMV